MERSGTAKQNKAKEDKRQKNQAYEASRASQYWLLLLAIFFLAFSLTASRSLIPVKIRGPLTEMKRGSLSTIQYNLAKSVI